MHFSHRTDLPALSPYEFYFILKIDAFYVTFLQIKKVCPVDKRPFNTLKSQQTNKK